MGLNYIDSLLYKMSLDEIDPDEFHDDLAEYLFSSDGTVPTPPEITTTCRIIQSAKAIEVAPYDRYLPHSPPVEHIPILLLTTIVQNAALSNKIIQDDTFGSSGNLLFGYDFIYAVFGYIYEVNLAEIGQNEATKKTKSLLWIHLHQMYTQFNVRKGNWLGDRSDSSTLITRKLLSEDHIGLNDPASGDSNRLACRSIILNRHFVDKYLSWNKVLHVPTLGCIDSLLVQNVETRRGLFSLVSDLNNRLTQRRGSVMSNSYDFGGDIPSSLQSINSVIYRRQSSPGLGSFRFLELLGDNYLSKPNQDLLKNVKDYSRFARTELFPDVHDGILRLINEHRTNCIESIRDSTALTYVRTGSDEIIF